MTPFYVCASKGADSTIFYTFGIDQSNVIVFVQSYCSMPIHVLQYVIHAQKWSCTHLSFGTYVQKRRVIFVHA